MPVEYTCIVCGKKFPQGQGIIIVREGLELHFHSKACLARFSQRLFNEAPDLNCIAKTVDSLAKEFRSLHAKEKRI